MVPGTFEKFPGLVGWQERVGVFGGVGHFPEGGAREYQRRITRRVGGANLRKVKAGRLGHLGRPRADGFFPSA